MKVTVSSARQLFIPPDCRDDVRGGPFGGQVMERCWPCSGLGLGPVPIERKMYLLPKMLTANQDPRNYWLSIGNPAFVSSHYSSESQGTVKGNVSRVQRASVGIPLTRENTTARLPVPTAFPSETPAGTICLARQSGPERQSM